MATVDRPLADAGRAPGALTRSRSTASAISRPEAFRAAAHRVVDLMADYLAGVERFAVLPAIRPGSVAERLPPLAPDAPEDLDAILADYLALIEPNATHWQHPGFLAYFASTASGPGILGEMLVAALGQNPMLWRTSPSGTELEQVVVGLAAPGARAARRVRRPPHRHRIDVVADRPRRGQAGRRDRRRGGRIAGRPDVPALRSTPRRRPTPRSTRRA